jgi:phosphoribosylanthranilate isomerase
MTDPGLVKLASSCGVDMLGFILVPTSPRYCHPALASEYIEWLRVCAPKTKSVVVMVSDSPEEVTSVHETLQPDFIQLHTNMSADKFNQMAIPGLIKVFAVKGPMKESEIVEFKADLYLFDTYKKGQSGGTGQTFDWGWLPMSVMKQAIIAGGLCPEDIPGIVKQYHPYGVDLNSKLEIAPGRKSPARIEKAIRYRYR